MNSPRRKTPAVRVGDVWMGGEHPVVVQSMTNTPTADVEQTVSQVRELAQAGAELVRITVNDEAAMRAVPEIRRRLDGQGCRVPLIGDFHYNGHRLLDECPEGARVLEKYRINPGNVGGGGENFATIVRIARDLGKAVRIGVNWGSLDPRYVALRMNRNARRKKPLEPRELVRRTMVDCALESLEAALALGLGEDRLVLSVKMSHLPGMVDAYTLLARKCGAALHLGLTEAGSETDGVVASSAALAVLLRQGIGDTIRVSITPGPGEPRAREVEVCRSLLQALEMRFFHPTVISCPGCGRTRSRAYEELAREVREYVKRRAPEWRRIDPASDRMQIAVMGCVVNGPGESRQADVGISLPGDREDPVALVYAGAALRARLKGDEIRPRFFEILEETVRARALRPETARGNDPKGD